MSEEQQDLGHFILTLSNLFNPFLEFVPLKIQNLIMSLFSHTLLIGINEDPRQRN